jgi:FkbM family methyltransferase
MTGKSRVRRLLAGALRDAGFYRLGPHPFGVIDRAIFLKRHRISLVIDAGANEGQYASAMRSIGYHGRIVSFEPSSTTCETLARKAARDSRWEARCLALGEEDGEAVFNLASASVCNSFLSMGNDFPAQVPGVERTSGEMVLVRKLDTVARDIVKDDDRLWVKLDVEGYELPSLRGASETLTRASVLEVELATAALYEGEPLFFDVARLIYQRGFCLEAVADAYQSPDGRTLRFDALFDRPVDL